MRARREPSATSVKHNTRAAATGRVCLVHWNAGEGAPRAERLRAAGYDTWLMLPDPSGLRELRENPPMAIVIDLSRLPSHGRAVGLALRQDRRLRHLPLVFVDGLPEKVQRVRASLPDAGFATWSGIRGALRKAIAHPPAAPIVHKSLLQGYSGTPLVRKLGIKEGAEIGRAHV